MSIIKRLVIDSDTDAFDAAIERVLAENEIVNSRLTDTKAEAEIVEEEVKQLVKTSESSFRKIASAGRKTASFLIGMARASGAAINEALAGALETTLLVIETAVEIAAIESLSIVTAAKAAARVALIFALIKRSDLLEQQRTKEAARFSGVIQALTPFTYVFMLPLYVIIVVIEVIT